MRGGRPAAVLISAKARASGLPAHRIAVNELRYAARGGDTGRHLGRQVDQHVEVPGRRGGGRQEHRRNGEAGGRDGLVRHEAAVAEGPEQLVELPQFFYVGVPDQDGVAGLVGFFDDAAGRSQAVARAVSFDYVEVYASGVCGRGGWRRARRGFVLRWRAANEGWL